MSIEINNTAAFTLEQDGDIREAIKSFHLALLELPTSLVGRRKKVSSVSNDCIDTLDSLYYYPDKSYDEGMLIFSHPVFIQPTCTNIEVAKATIYFNIGLAHTRTQEDPEGLLWFRKAFDTIGCSGMNELELFLETSNERKLINKNTILHNIGHVHWRAGRYNDAIVIYSKALESLAKTLKHLLKLQGTTRAAYAQKTMCYISANLNCIGVSRFYAKDEDLFPVNETLDLLNRALSTLNEVTESHGNKTLIRAATTILNNIGRVKFAAGKFEDALFQYQETCYHRRAILGDDHLDVAVAHYNIAEAQNYLGNFQDAINSYEQFLGISQLKLGHGHRDVAGVLVTLGQLYVTIQDPHRAIDCFTMAIKSSRLAFGKNHECVAVALNQLGNAAFDAGYIDAAIETYEAGLAIERSLKNSEDKIVVTLLNIANVSKIQGKNDEAIARYEETLAILRTQSGKHEELSKTLTSIAFIYDHQGKYSLASAMMSESITIRKEAFGSHNFDVSTSLNALGLIQFKQNDISGALHSFSEALSIRQSISEANPNDISTVCNNVAATYRHIGDIDKALHFYKETLRLDQMSAKVSANHCPENALTCLQQIASLYKRKKQYDKALECYKEAVCLCALNRNCLELEDILKAVRDLHSFKEFMLLLQECNNSFEHNSEFAPAA